MSSLGLLCVFLGVLIIVTRAPLVFAPEWERALILRWLAMPGFMRGFAVFALLAGLALLWFAHPFTGLLATLLTALGGLLCFVGLITLPFPQVAQGLATRVWSGFSTGTLRVLGLVAVTFGGILIAYGLAL